ERHVASVRLEEAEDQPGQRRLSTSRFADAAERLLARDAARDVVDCTDPGVRAEKQPGTDRKVFPQAAHLQQRCAHARISIASRSPSDSRLNDIEVRKIATPGSAGTQAFTKIGPRSVLIIRPHSAAGGVTPRPRKESPAARMIDSETCVD